MILMSSKQCITVKMILKRSYKEYFMYSKHRFQSNVPAVLIDVASTEVVESCWSVENAGLDDFPNDVVTALKDD